MNGAALPGSGAHLLEYVRSFYHSRSLDRAEYPMRNLSQDSGEYLLALRNLRCLCLFRTRVEHISDHQFRTCFSAFRETLTSLCLQNITMSFSAFVALVDCFPNIATLELRCPEVEPDEEPVPPLSRPLRGKVFVLVRLVPDNFPEFLDRFSELDLEYEELKIYSPFGMRTKCLESALRTSARTVKLLKLPELERE